MSSRHFIKSSLHSWTTPPSNSPMQSSPSWKPQDPLHPFPQPGTGTPTFPNTHLPQPTNNAPLDQNNLPAYTTFPAPASLSLGAKSSPSPFQPSLSNETQEMLRRVGASPGTLRNNAAGINAGSPQWEAARQQVLKSVGSTSAGPGTVSPAGAPRGRVAGKQVLAREGEEAMGFVATPDAGMHGHETAQSTPTRGRARGGEERVVICLLQAS